MLVINTIEVLISNKVIQGIFERNSGSLIRWISPSDNVEWLVIGAAKNFSNSKNAVATIKRITANSAEYKGIIRCFVALPYRTNLWDQGYLWVLPRWILRKVGENWEGIEVLPASKRNKVIIAQENNLVHYYDRNNEASIEQREHRQSVTPLLETRSPDPESWCDQVIQIKKHISDKSIKKAVLSRQEIWKTDREISCPLVFENMCQSAPDSIKFQYPTNSGNFMGVSPEILFSLQGKTINVDSLAGTRARSSDPEEDNHLCNELKNSIKDIEEHAIVTKAILDRLKILCRKVEEPTKIVVKKFRTVQHLFCRVTGELNTGVIVDEILRVLHPTPAIVGEPRSESYNILREIGEPERGYYSGPVGWIDEDNAEFAVGIRSAIIKRNRFTLYAGAGIVKDSDPKSEWEETNLKLQVMLNNIIGVQYDSSK